MRKQNGFTLIELLVVIAIIAILAAILFPVFAQAREKARMASCLSNCKQISLAMTMYTNDYDEMLLWNPWPGGVNGAPGCGAGNSNQPNLIWTEMLMPYIKNTQVFECPSIAPSITLERCPACLSQCCYKAGQVGSCAYYRANYFMADGSIPPYCITYGLNYVQMGQNCSPTSLAQLQAPAQIALAGDSIGQEWGSDGPGFTLPTPDTGIIPPNGTGPFWCASVEWDYGYPIHQNNGVFAEFTNPPKMPDGWINFVFADGHAKANRVTWATSPPYSADCMGGYIGSYLQ